MNCQKCGKKCEKIFCFHCKPRKPLKSNKTFSKSNDKENNDEMWNFFLSIWKERRHQCENCGKMLGNEARSYMFDHVLEKSKYPELKYEKSNICILCLECHDNKTRGILSVFIRNLIKKTRLLFDK